MTLRDDLLNADVPADVATTMLEALSAWADSMRDDDPCDPAEGFTPREIDQLAQHVDAALRVIAKVAARTTPPPFAR